LEQFAVSEVTAGVLSGVSQPWRRSAVVFATRLLPCRWYVIWSQFRPLLFQVCQVATVVMETKQLVLSQF